MSQYSLYGQRISETYPRLLQITSGDTVLDGSGDTRSLYVNGSFSADTIFIGSSDLNNIFAPIGAIGSGATTFIKNGLNTYTGGTLTSPTVNISAATLSYLSATTISGDTIYSGSTDLYQIFSTIGSQGDIVRVQPGSNIITAGTVNAPIIGVVESPSFNNLTLSGLGQFNSVSASSFSATSFYSGATNLYSIFATIGSSGPSTFVQPGLNTYTGGTNEAPTVNVSAATLSYLSASTISGSSLYVQGPFKYVDGNQGSTKVLTSDAFGNASWQEIPAIGIGTFMFVSGASDIATYKQMVPLNLYNSDGLIQDTTNVTTTPTLIGGFATNEGYPGITFIPLGNFLAHFETKKSAGSNNYYSFYEVFKYSSGGSETYLFSSDTSTVTSSNQVVQNTLYSHVTSGITLEQTDRIIVKIFSVMLSSSANITLQYDNNTGASFIMPSSSVDTTHLIPYTGATSNVDLGSYNLSSNEINGNVLLSGNTNLSQIFATTGSTYLPTQQIAFGSSNSGITGNTNLTWNGNYVNIDSNSLTQLYLTGPGAATSIGHNSGIFFIGGTGGGMQIFNAAVNTLAAEFLITRSGIYSPLTIYSGARSNSFSSTTLSAGTFYSGSTPLETIITNLSIGGTSTYVQPGLNTYTGGTSSAPTVNISAATLSYLSATTVSANTAYLLNMQPNQVAFVHPSTSGLTGDTWFKFHPNTVGGGYGQIGYLNLGYGIAYGGYFGIDMSAFGTSRISSSLSIIELDRITGFGNVSIIVQNRRSLRGDYSGVTFGPSLETESTARVDITSGTSIIPQLRVRSGETYSGSYLDGSIWNDGSHLYGMFGGEVRVLDSGSTGNGSQTFVQPGLNTYTGGTSSAPTVNISAATLSYLSASTISGGTFYGDGSGLSGLGNSITVTLGWKFDTSTTSSDPGSGNFRFNNSTPANISEIFVDNNTTNGINASVILNRLRSGSEIYVQQKDNPSTAILFSVTSSTVDNSGWFTIPVAYVSDNGGVVPQNNKDCVFILFNAPSTDSNTYVTGFTYNDANRLTIQQNDVSDLSVFINTMTGLTVTGGISGGTISGGTFYSGATSLETIFRNIEDVTRIQAGSNMATGGTENSPFVSVVSSPSLNDLILSGFGQFNATTSTIFSGGTISGGTFYSGSTPLETIITNLSVGGTSTYVQPGLNTYTGGTNSAPTVNISAATLVTISGGTISGGTIYSGSTDLNDVFHRKSGYLLQKAGLLSGSTFTGSPRKSTVTFTTPFANNLYSINVTGEINRTWSIESRTASGFTISSNSTTAFSSSVFWSCCEIGEGYR